MSVDDDLESEKDYVLVANPGESAQDEDYVDKLRGDNNFTTIYDSKIQPLSGGRGNYIMPIEDHWPNTDDVLAVDPRVLKPFIPEGHIAKVSRNIPVWINSEKESINTVMDFPNEFYEQPMRYEIIIGSKPSGPRPGGSQKDPRSSLEGEHVRVTNIKSGSKPIIQDYAPLNQVANQLDPESEEARELRELLEMDAEDLGS